MFLELECTEQLVVNAAFLFTGVNIITESRKCRKGKVKNVCHQSTIRIMSMNPTTNVMAGQHKGYVISHQKSVPIQRQSWKAK